MCFRVRVRVVVRVMVRVRVVVRVVVRVRVRVRVSLLRRPDVSLACAEFPRNPRS